MRMLPSVPDVQISRFRFFMEEFRSRRCSDGRSGLPAEGDAVGVKRTGSWGDLLGFGVQQGRLDFEVGNQVLISSHRELLWSKAMVVSVAEKSEQDSDR